MKEKINKYLIKIDERLFSLLVFVAIFTFMFFGLYYALYLQMYILGGFIHIGGFSISLSLALYREKLKRKSRSFNDNNDAKNILLKHICEGRNEQYIKYNTNVVDHSQTLAAMEEYAMFRISEYEYLKTHILVKNGDIFDGTRRQFMDCFFTNADDAEITDWCVENGWNLQIDGEIIIS